LNRRPLIGALVMAAAVVLPLAAPAGASPNKDWKVVKLPCRTGHNSATLGYSPTHPWWGDSDPDTGEGIQNPHGWASWMHNPCKGQWLIFTFWHGDPSEDSNTVVSMGTGTSGHFPGVTDAGLADAPVCDVQGADRDVEAKDPNVALHACDTTDNS
jgi:hypothetical protein